jgi:hypothetical protein
MTAMYDEGQWPACPSGLMVLEGELASATADGSDTPHLQALVPVLHRLRNAFGMEMAFVAQLRDGLLAAREATGFDDCNPFEEAFGRGLLEQRCGSAVFAAVAVCSDDGIEAGTLVCGVPAGDGGYQPPPDSLKSVSRLLASSMRRIDTRGA